MKSNNELEQSDEERSTQNLPPSRARKPLPETQPREPQDSMGYREMMNLNGFSPDLIERNFNYYRRPAPFLSNYERQVTSDVFPASKKAVEEKEDGPSLRGFLTDPQSWRDMQKYARETKHNLQEAVRHAPGFLTDKTAWQDMRRNAGDVAVSTSLIPLGTAERLRERADTVTDGGGSKGLEEIRYRPDEAKALLTSHYSDDHQKRWEEYENTEHPVDKAALLARNPGLMFHVWAKEAPEFLVDEGLKSSFDRATGMNKAVSNGAIEALNLATEFRQQNGGKPLTPEQEKAGVKMGLSNALLNGLAESITGRLPGVGKMFHEGIKGGANEVLKQRYRSQGNKEENNTPASEAFVNGAVASAINPFSYLSR